MPKLSIKSLSRNATIAFLLVLVLVALAFQESILAMLSFSSGKPMAIIVHSITLVLWTLMLVAQPILIYFKRVDLHRVLGKLSMVLVAVFVVSTVLAALHSFEKLHGTVSPSKGNAYLAVQFLGLGVFLIQYVLAIVNKRHLLKHTQYFIASTISLLGPTIFRLVGRMELVLGGSSEFAANVFTYSAFNICLLILCFVHYRRKESFFPYVLTILLMVPNELPQLYFSYVEPLF